MQTTAFAASALRIPSGFSCIFQLLYECLDYGAEVLDPLGLAGWPPVPLHLSSLLKQWVPDSWVWYLSASTYAAVKNILNQPVLCTVMLLAQGTQTLRFQETFPSSEGQGLEINAKKPFPELLEASSSTAHTERKPKPHPRTSCAATSWQLTAQSCLITDQLLHLDLTFVIPASGLCPEFLKKFTEAREAQSGARARQPLH